jgi:outer membrane biosynthesis protein TonB
MFAASAWWLVSIFLGGATVGLVWLLRTRWNWLGPLKKCAILSLWVHIVLACLTSMVHIFSGSPGLGPEEPIRVALVSVEEPAPETPSEPEVAPDWLRPKEPSLVAPELEPLPERTSEPTTASEADVAIPPPQTESTVPPSTDPPSPDPPPQIAAPSDPIIPTPSMSASARIETEPAPAKENVPKQTVVASIPPSSKPSLADSIEPPSTNRKPPPSLPIYADRFAENRQPLVTRRGGNEQTERAVRSALAWLAGAQSEDGRWDASRFGAGEERIVLGHNRNHAGANADTGITGLALLTFLGSGQTHQHGCYSVQVARGLGYLQRSQSDHGALDGNAQLFARTYCHSMATFAVCEAYALTKDPWLAPIARKATVYSLQCQNRRTGGWRYRPGDEGDTSQMGWQMMALESATMAGIEIPPTTWTRIQRFLRRVQRGTEGGLAAYRPDGPATRTMTAEALYCRYLLGDHAGDFMETRAVSEAARAIASHPPSVESMNLYYWYYATLALYRAREDSPAAGEIWEIWNQTLIETLLQTQLPDGSWSASTVWGGYGGRVYSTALSALCLEIYYRYKPSQKPVGIAGRGSWESIRR